MKQEDFNLQGLTPEAAVEYMKNLSFKAKMPVFEGEQEKVFLIEVQCEARNRAVEFWLESTELVELLEVDTKSIIDAQLERIPEEFVFIQK